MHIDLLLLENKSDIYIREIGEFMHQPTIKEISDIVQGEVAFFSSMNKVCQTIIDKKAIEKNKQLSKEAKEELKQIASFDYLFALMGQDVALFYELNLLFKLFFPKHICNLDRKVENNKVSVVFNMTPIEEGSCKPFFIDKNNYDTVIEYIKLICCLKSELASKADEEEEFNPANEAARRIMEQIQAGRKKVQEIKSKENEAEYYLAKMQNLLRRTGNFSCSELEDMTIYILKQTYQGYLGYDAKKDQSLYHANGFEIKEFIDWMKDIT